MADVCSVTNPGTPEGSGDTTGLWGAATQVLGRRTALKYLGYGVGSAAIATLLSACSGGSFADKAAGSAFTKFMVGTWDITVNGNSHYKSATLKVDKGGSWKMTAHVRDSDDSDTESGTWSVGGGKLKLVFDDADHRAEASTVPDSVPDKISQSLKWSLIIADSDGSGDPETRTNSLNASWSSSTSTLTLKPAAAEPSSGPARPHPGGGSIVAVRR